MPLTAEELYNNINSTISLPQWKAWEGKQSSDCPPERPFKTDKTVSGGDQNECVETPDNCPEGTRAFGKNKCLPVDAREFGGDGRGSPGGPNAPGTRPFGGPGGPGGRPGGMYPYAGPEGVYGNEYVGGDYGLSSMYQKLLGNRAQSQSVLAPQIEALQAQKEGQVQSIMASIPPGGQRDRALAELEKGFSSSLGQLRQGLVTSSISGLQGLYGTQLGDATNRYGIDVGADTARYGIDVGAGTAKDQLGLGYAQLGQQGSQFDRNLDWSQNQFGQQLGWDKDKFGQQLDWDKSQFNTNRSDQRRAGLSNLIGGLTSGLLGGGNQKDTNAGGGGGSWWKKALGIGASVAPMLFSDPRTKEDVEPFTSGLAEIVKLMPIEATYNGKAGTPKGERLTSVMADAMEKVLPEGVKTVETEDLGETKMISPLTILMTSVNALKEVDTRLKKLEKKRGRN